MFCIHVAVYVYMSIRRHVHMASLGLRLWRGLCKWMGDFQKRFACQKIILELCGHWVAGLTLIGALPFDSFKAQ